MPSCARTLALSAKKHRLYLMCIYELDMSDQSGEIAILSVHAKERERERKRE